MCQPSSIRYSVRSSHPCAFGSFGGEAVQTMEIVAVFTAVASALAAAGALFNGWQIAKLIGRVDTLERELRAR